MKKINLIVATALAVNVFATSIIYAQSVRDYPTIAAGYAPYPMAVAVSEQLTQSGKLKKAPNIQSTSPELAYKQFCASYGIESLDAAVVLRPMTADEQELCANNDVKDILKFKTGVTAVVIAFTGNIKDFELLSRKDLFLAMAKDIPDPQGGGKLIPNSYKTWKEINPAFPDIKIQIWNSSPVFAYYQVVLNQIMLAGCKQFAALKNLEVTDPKNFEAICTTFRKDGAYSEYDNLDTVVQKLNNGMGIFTEAFANKFNLNKLPIDGVEPLQASIARNLYPVVSPLMLYVKRNHLSLVAGLKEYLVEATSESAIATSGYLLQQGLIPLPLLERRQIQTEVQSVIK